MTWRQRPSLGAVLRAVELPEIGGDTLWAESEILETRPSSTNPDVGIVSMRTRGVNQRGQVVIEYLRTFMAYRRSAPQAASLFPDVDAPWRVGPTG